MVDVRQAARPPRQDPRPGPRPLEDLDWRRIHLDQMTGGTRRSSRFAWLVLLALVVVGAAGAGWFIMSPSPGTGLEPDLLAPIPDVPSRAASIPQEPPPKPYRNLFTVRDGQDGGRYVVYTITADDDLKTIGEKLHEVTGFPRVLTYQVVEDAYWKQFFDYDQQNVDVTRPEKVKEHAGESILIPVPLDGLPDVDLAGRVDLYNQT